MSHLKYIPFIILLFIFYEQNAQTISVPVNIQMSLFGKILTFDKSLDSKIQNNKIINICILYQSKNRNSLNLRNEVLENISDKQIDKVIGGKTNIQSFDIEDTESFEKYIKNKSIDIVIITSLKAVKIESIATLCQLNKIMSFSLVPEYIDEGISVAIDIKGEKPQIVINLYSSQKEGVNFSSQLLKLSKIVK